MTPQVIWTIIVALLGYFGSRKAGLPVLAAAAVGVGAGMATYDYLTPPAVTPGSSGVSTTQAGDADQVASKTASSAVAASSTSGASGGVLSSLASFAKNNPLTSLVGATGLASIVGATWLGFPIWLWAGAAYLLLKD